MNQVTNAARHLVSSSGIDTVEEPSMIYTGRRYVCTVPRRLGAQHTYDMYLHTSIVIRHTTFQRKCPAHGEKNEKDHTPADVSMIV